MKQVFPTVKLGQVITHRKESIIIDDAQNYKRCRVQSYGKGVVLRDIVSGTDIKTKQQQVCRAGEFLVAEIDAKVGGFGIVPLELDGAIVSSHYFLFTLDESQVDKSYLSYYVKTPDFQDQVTAKGSTNYAAIRPQHVLDYVIPLPSIGEQRRIVAHIDALAEQIAAARGLRLGAVEEAEALVEAEAHSIFGRMNIRISELQEWTNPHREGIQTGPFGAMLGSDDFLEEGYPVITIGNIQYEGLRLSGLKFVSEDKAKDLIRYMAQTGDILFARMGTVGRCCVVPEDANGWIFNYHIIRVAPDHTKVNSRYIHWIIQASPDIDTYLQEKIRGATREGVNTKIVAKLPCRVPSIEEQREIVAYLDALQAEAGRLKRLQEETAAELDALLPSLLDRAFRGEL